MKKCNSWIWDTTLIVQWTYYLCFNPEFSPWLNSQWKQQCFLSPLHYPPMSPSLILHRSNYVSYFFCYTHLNSNQWSGRRIIGLVACIYHLIQTRWFRLLAEVWLQYPTIAICLTTLSWSYQLCKFLWIETKYALLSQGANNNYPIFQIYLSRR